MKATKPEVIGVIFAKLKPSSNDVFADIGCGTGGVSEFFAPYVRKIFAVDIDERAVEEAKIRLKDTNSEVLCINGLEFLKKYDYDLVFFGGTKQIKEMLEIACKKAKRVAVSAARMEVAIRAFEKIKSLGLRGEILAINVWKGYELAGGTAFKPLNPVFLVVGCSSE